MTYPDASKSLKRKIEQLQHLRIETLRQVKFEDLIATHSAFFRSGEITNAGELVFHVLDEFMIERENGLFNALRQKIKSRIHRDKIGYYAAMSGHEYEEEFNTTLNRLTHEFLKEYSRDGEIDWRNLAGL